MIPLKGFWSILSGLFQAEPHRPMVGPAPSFPGYNLRSMTLPFLRSQKPLGVNLGFSFLKTLKECFYFLLCCWCIKELLD
ncbi:hypothetical protein GDO86_019982 [Hymenochirus boettgeri]|uniref:Lens epithelial protein n=1 Tax=Hymenochirus boettgeri TaxID=247094 RepID=A0A8T2IJT6_9PIPI|nr:hypothetical protein GDO86_019982 [Hymenochirus boettgeri]